MTYFLLYLLGGLIAMRLVRHRVSLEVVEKHTVEHSRRCIYGAVRSKNKVRWQCYSCNRWSERETVTNSEGYALIFGAFLFYPLYIFAWFAIAEQISPIAITKEARLKRIAAQSTKTQKAIEKMEQEMGLQV